MQNSRVLFLDNYILFNRLKNKFWDVFSELIIIFMSLYFNIARMCLNDTRANYWLTITPKHLI